jgi:hypothetical protein
MKFSPKTEDLVKRGKRPEDPVAFLKATDGSVFTFVKNKDNGIVDVIKEHGYLVWHAVNFSTVRQASHKFYSRVDRGFIVSDSGAKSLTSDFEVEVRVERSKKGNEYYSENTWSERFKVIAGGNESLISRLLAETMRSKFFVETNGVIRVSKGEEMIPQSRELNQICGCQSSEKKLDVVFVHGLNGDPFLTWTKGNDQSLFWPRWLGNDLPACGVWSYSFNAAASDWQGKPLDLFDRAHHLLEILDVHGCGHKPLIFVTHSLGGLIVKQALRLASTETKWKPLYDRIAGILFFATPHTGSDYANFFSAIRLGRPSALLEVLKQGNGFLKDLNQWFRSYVQSSRTKVDSFAEKKGMGFSVVVDETSSDFGFPGHSPIPVEHNHQNICKFDSPQDIRYLKVKAFLGEILRPLVTN